MRLRLRARFRYVLGSVAACGLGLAGITPVLAGVPLSADFDYEVQERFEIPPLGTGLGAEAGEFYTNPVPAVGAENAFIQPETWKVHFDACTSTGAIIEYRWTVDGEFAAAVAGCADFAFDFGALGVHRVSLGTVDSLMNEAMTARDIDIRDFLIVSLGDSVASGEGVPDVPIAQFDIDAADAAQGVFDAAQSSAASSSAALQQAIADLAQLQADVDEVFGLQEAYLDAIAADDACANPFECVATAGLLLVAINDLFNALDDLGLFELGIDDPTSVTNALSELIAAFTLSRDDAQATSDADEGFLATAEADLGGALAALEPSWRNRRCHRSALSGPVQAARRIAESDPHSSVTFIHLPCSGATIETGVIGPYDGIDPIEMNEVTGALQPASLPLPAQIARARELICGASCDESDRVVDVFLLSVGANDVNFAEIVDTCIVGEPCFSNPVPDVGAAGTFAFLCAGLGAISSGCDDFYGSLESFDAEEAFLDGRNEPPPNGLDDLPTHYQSLQTALGSTFGAGAASALFLTEYPDITRDGNGASCGWEITQPLAEQTMNLPGVSPAEMMWADAVVQTELTAAMQTAAGVHGWNFVGGIASAFRTHGYCAEDNWVNRVQESFLAQGGIEGSLHPSAVGQLVYRDAILSALPEPGARLQAAAALATLAFASRLRLRSRIRSNRAKPLGAQWASGGSPGSASR